MAALPPKSVLSRWGFEGARATRVPIGLINRTFRVEHEGAFYALQRLHPIFRAEVNEDIDAITAHLERKGIVTPRLVRTRDGAASATDEEGAVWRVTTWVPGDVVETLRDPASARSAGELVARFHGALVHLEHTFAFTRPGAHDTPRHLRKLGEVLASHRGHASFADVEPLGRRILAHAETLPAIGTLPRRIVHGDLKISNVVFDGDQRAIALIDLDTIQHGTIAVELGDALRSWCNPAGESSLDAALDVASFEAAVRGYAAGAAGFLEPEEIASIVPGLETIALELAARFCSDALEETYFGWDASRFASRSEHNLVRATSQLAVAEAVRGQRGRLSAMVTAAFG